LRQYLGFILVLPSFMSCYRVESYVTPITVNYLYYRYSWPRSKITKDYKNILFSYDLRG